MKIKRVFFFILLSILLVSCAPVESLSTATSIPTVTTLPTNTATAPPIATPTSMSEVVQVSCPEIRNDTPTNDIDGKIVLNGAYLVYDESVGHFVINPGSAYLWDVKNNKMSDLLQENGEELLAFSVSPDHKSLVYHRRRHGGSTNRVVVTDSDGQVIRNIDGYNWFLPLGWLDNKNLAIWMLSDVTDGPPFPTLIYNPFTRARKLIMPDYPNIYWWHIPNWPSTLTAYDPSANFVVYITEAGNGNGNGSVVLWDINTKREILKLRDLAIINNNNAPLWSPSGQEFLIDAKLEDHPSFELYSINLHGEIQQLAHFENLVGQQTARILTFWNYSWSGDGRYIAFWYRIGEQKVAQLALLDTSNQKIKNLCISSYRYFTPIWSPDNQQLLINGFIDEREAGNDYRVILVDIQDNYAVEIAEGVSPEGWLLSEP